MDPVDVKKKMTKEVQFMGIVSEAPGKKVNISTRSFFYSKEQERHDLYPVHTKPYPCFEHIKLNTVSTCFLFK